MLVQKGFRLFQGNAHLGSNQVFTCHHIADFQGSVSHKPEITVGNDSGKFFPAQHRDPGYLVICHHGLNFRNPLVFSNSYRVNDHAGFRFFDLFDLAGLFID